MTQPQNDRETGARKLPDAGRDIDNNVSQTAAKNKPPASGMGNAEPVDDVNEKTRHSDGQSDGTEGPSGASNLQKGTGAGPGIAEHSKDAAAATTGQTPGAGV